MLVASVSGLFIQALSANLGVITGRHLAEHCREEYPTNVRIGLWLIAELAIVASDIPEVIGTAFAFNILIGLPVWIGVLVTGASTLLLLAVQQYGVRKLEVLIALLVLVMALCFFVEMGFAHPNVRELLEGLTVPRLSGSRATAIAISLVGSNVMPHNLYLHSALVLTRKVPRTSKGIRDGCRYNFAEVSIGLLIAFAINVAVISVSGAVCSSDALSPSDLKRCGDLNLNEVPFLLQHTLGSWSPQLFGIALLASGQSSTVTGTYAGQYVMQGFLDLKMEAWVRNLLTRSVAIVPSLAVALLGGSSGAGELIIFSSIVLAFQLPFALIPLLKFTSSPVKVGLFTNHKLVDISIWSIGVFVIGINIYFLVDLFVKFLRSTNLHILIVIVIGLAGFLGILVYLAAVAYLSLRPDQAMTFIEMQDSEDMLSIDLLSRADYDVDQEKSPKLTPLPLESMRAERRGQALDADAFDAKPLP
eukprot:SM000060S19638  [mRNA]  locus=s60:196507:199845:- [translate_table: standard]